MTPQENETWAEVTWKPGHGPDATDATDEQIREWALACQAESSKSPGSFYAALWARTPRWDFPRPRLPRMNRTAWRRRFWLTVPHRRAPYLNLKDEPLIRSVLADRCRRCGR